MDGDKIAVVEAKDIVNGYAEDTVELYTKYGEAFESAVTAVERRTSELVDSIQTYTKAKQLDEIVMVANKIGETLDKIAKVHYQVISSDGGAVDTMTSIKEATVPNIAEQGREIKAAMEWSERSYQFDFEEPNGDTPMDNETLANKMVEICDCVNVFVNEHNETLLPIAKQIVTMDPCDLVAAKIAIPFNESTDFIGELQVVVDKFVNAHEEVLAEHRMKANAMKDDLESVAKADFSKAADELNAEIQTEIGSLE